MVILCMVSLDVSPALAGLVSSTRSGDTSITSTRDGDMLAAKRALENKVVAQKLRDYGVSPEDVQVRLASASKGLPSGGDSTGALIGILVVIILVIVILKLLHKDVVVK